MKARSAYLVLGDGTLYPGQAFGADPSAGKGSGEGEVVFHTGMTGYQEILTDPSYAGQIVCMTYPEIGNTGCNPEDEESRGLFLRGFVVRSYNERPSSWRSRETLDAYLKRHAVPGISGIDTRALVRHLRTVGAMNGVIAHGEHEPAELRARAAAIPSMAGLNLVDGVTEGRRYDWSEGNDWRGRPRPVSKRRHRIVAYDYGVKRNILRELVDAGFDVTVVPADTSAAETLALKPEGVFLGNGPGDPAAVGYAIPIVRELVAAKTPIFGICLGHQILGLALGGRTRKLRFGHHGANQPARDEQSGRVMIASENHGFAVDADALRAAGDVEITHVNLNDGTVEGLRHRTLPVFSVQYHPEASPGPHDLAYLFDRFRELIEDQHA
ncbi:MAG TPA: glutamine-hydrolyzing carbamoyl-phosphate synthase small subunit [Myxococcota bacterium]|nr:glutamine-hydrolyzing carbamoyl-phosphate synthase small subunit [Myxococcota bacterium]